MQKEKITIDVEKKIWTTPKLVVYGSVENITGWKPKDPGTSDDLTDGIDTVCIY